MPKSRVRKKPVYTPPPTRASSKKRKVSPPWLAPTMIACFLVGLAWIAVYYITGQTLPIGAIGVWNLAIGFVLIVTGLGLATRWR